MSRRIVPIVLAVLLTGGPTVLAASTAQDASWQTYRNESAGYAVDYPAAWTVAERTERDGSLLTTFAPTGGGPGIAVITRASELAEGDDGDLPHTRCQPVTVGGLSGRRCFDTIAFSTITALVAQGKSNLIVTIGRRLDPAIYQRLLDSFQVLA